MNKPELNIIHTQIDRIGELADQIFKARNLYGKDYDLIIRHWPINEKVNKAVFKIMTRGISAKTFYKNKEIKALNAAVKRWPEVAKEFVAWSKNNIPWYMPIFSEKEIEQGEQLRRDFGIPGNAKIVVLHVREPGYLPELKYHRHRDANIETYKPAVKYLTDNGYYVVRIGDSSMKPIHWRNVVDTTRHDAYQQILEPYFIYQANLYLGMSSGPNALAVAFCTPQVLSHVIYGESDSLYRWPHDIRLFKKTKKDGRILTQQEIDNSDIYTFTRAEEFENAGVELIDNTSDEILDAVKKSCRKFKRRS